ncbi:MAG: type I restriction enzyme HsdR N-terminal domain-containing protein [Bacteroidales bacterium]|nr:type I restriction enzyme HsdR N-terminal domain-containing protein [Bacteroidales bacterium]
MDVRKTIWDPLRKKEVALTPEERVRQWCIGVLAGQMQVPMHLMMSEAGFKLGGKQFRADIIVYDRNVQPLMVVECKRPEVELTQYVLDQAIRYNMVLDVRYMIITNGTRTFICRRQGEGFTFMDTVPTYNEMVCQQQ